MKLSTKPTKFCPVCLGPMLRDGDACSAECMAVARLQLGADEEWPAWRTLDMQGKGTLYLMGFARESTPFGGSVSMRSRCQISGHVRRILVACEVPFDVQKLCVDRCTFLMNATAVPGELLHLLSLDAEIFAGQDLFVHAKPIRPKKEHVPVEAIWFSAAALIRARDE